MTQKYLPVCTYVVAESEKAEYEKNGNRVWAIPDDVQGNVSRVRNYILNHAPEPWVVMIDDDIRCLARWEGNKRKDLTSDQAHEFLELCCLMANEWGTCFWGLNVSPDKGTYREYTPFSTTTFCGGPIQGHLQNPCRYDEKLPLKEDYDMTLQVLNRFRSILRFNFAFYDAKQAEQKGGCATYRTIDREKEQNNRLLKKWGPRIVSFDTGASKAKTRKGKVLYDINPIIRAPINGV